jgi:hypothetical protein
MSLTQIKTWRVGREFARVVASRRPARPRVSGHLKSATRAYGVAVDLSFYLRFTAVFTLVQSCLTLMNPSAPLSFRMP